MIEIGAHERLSYANVVAMNSPSLMARPESRGFSLQIRSKSQMPFWRDIAFDTLPSSLPTLWRPANGLFKAWRARKAGQVVAVAGRRCGIIDKVSGEQWTQPPPRLV
jgi:hypothetical protein